MQTFHSSPTNVKFLFSLTLTMVFSFLVTSTTFAINVGNNSMNDIELIFNGKTIDMQNVIPIAAINKSEPNTLLIKMNKNMLNENVNLEITLARGNRPVSSTQEFKFFSEIDINISDLLIQAKSGDRIVLALNNDKTVFSINIS